MYSLHNTVNSLKVYSTSNMKVLLQHNILQHMLVNIQDSMKDSLVVDHTIDNTKDSSTNNMKDHIIDNGKVHLIEDTIDNMKELIVHTVKQQETIQDNLQPIMLKTSQAAMLKHIQETIQRTGLNNLQGNTLKHLQETIQETLNKHSKQQQVM